QLTPLLTPPVGQTAVPDLTDGPTPTPLAPQLTPLLTPPIGQTSVPDLTDGPTPTPLAPQLTPLLTPPVGQTSVPDLTDGPTPTPLAPQLTPLLTPPIGQTSVPDLTDGPTPTPLAPLLTPMLTPAVMQTAVPDLTDGPTPTPLAPLLTPMLTPAVIQTTVPDLTDGPIPATGTQPPDGSTQPPDVTAPPDHRPPPLVTPPPDVTPGPEVTHAPLYSVPPGLPVIAPPGDNNPPIRPQITTGGVVPPTSFGGTGIPPGNWDIQTYSEGHQWNGTHQSRAEGEWGSATVSATGGVSYKEDPAKIAQHPGDVTSTSTGSSSSTTHGAINPGGHMLTNNGAFNGKAWWKVVTETGEVQTYSVETRSHSELYDVFYNGQYYGTYMISADTRTEHISGSRTWVGHQHHVGDTRHGHWEETPDQDIFHLANPVVNKLTGGDLTLDPAASSSDEGEAGQGDAIESSFTIELDPDAEALAGLSALEPLEGDAAAQDSDDAKPLQDHALPLEEGGSSEQPEGPPQEPTDPAPAPDGQGALPAPEALQQAVQATLEAPSADTTPAASDQQAPPDPAELQAALQELLNAQPAGSDAPPAGTGEEAEATEPQAPSEPPDASQLQAAAQAVLEAAPASSETSPQGGGSTPLAEEIPNTGATPDNPGNAEPDQALGAADSGPADFAQGLPTQTDPDDALPPAF
ncbi:MAG: hypothetical protein VKJ66_08670, partial [Synechococcus sp.]|nr:hypothetical protein [Synechococcus sp.]